MKKPVIAYYAPLKPPDHHIPSGDRQMARMLFATLGKAGYETFLASRYISYSKRHAQEYFDGRKQGAIDEAKHLLAQWERQSIRPDLWFCYHPYDKSPDWLGMEICVALNIPMVTAEPCKTSQGPNGEWIPWREAAQEGINMAAMNIVMTHSDEAYLETFIASEKIKWMPPFVDMDMLLSAEGLSDNIEPDELWKDGRKLLAVGMMRPGAKMESYQLLASALRNLQDENWSLVIVGSGPGAGDLDKLFDWDTSGRVNIVGEKSPEEVLLLMEHADILSWPGCREAYGMVYLEAASRGCPAMALRNLGVPLVVEDGQSGLLASPPDAKHYADCLKRLLNDDLLLAELSKAAAKFVADERGGEQTALRLKEIIDPVLVDHGR